MRLVAALLLLGTMVACQPSSSAQEKASIEDAANAAMRAAVASSSDLQHEQADAAKRNITGCAIGAISTETDPAGLNVRVGPGRQFPVVGVLHNLIYIEPESHGSTPEPSGEMEGPSFNIVAISGPWLKIDDIDPVIEGFEARSKNVVTRKNYQGTGWVHRSKIAIDPGFHDHAYDQPYAEPGQWTAIDVNAGELLALTGGKQGDTADLLSCRRNWLEIRYDREGLKRVGWFKMRPHYVGAKICRQDDPDCPARQNLEIWD